MATTAEGMVNDALKLRSIIADIVVKVPVTAEGLAAIKMLKAKGFRRWNRGIWRSTRAAVGAGRCGICCALR
ncbi:fructose-6-phosphate aldolase [Escherichia coli]|uniref:Fructose-6-phosphate aldolase n=1 Tax=Escherichia coli TaxID=562 RepID=A0A377AVI0_ECOLX|nr:fructose-6-phosphate aldolase [Escherichia coli]